MSDSRDRRNYSAGRRLADYKTRMLLGERVADAHGRGSKTAEQVCSGLASLARYLQDNGGPNHIEAVTTTHIGGWVRDLRGDVEIEELSRSTTSSYVSAVNQLMNHLGRENLLISGQMAKDAGINRGPRWDNQDKSNSAEAQSAFRLFLVKQTAKSEFRERIMLEGLVHSISGLQESAGLRFRESVCLKIAKKDLSGAALWLDGKGDRTKNSRDRMATMLGSEAVAAAQRHVLEHPEIYTRGSLIPGDMNYRQYRRWAYDKIDAFKKATSAEYRMHGNRHAYAQARFADLWEQRTGIRIESPVRAGIFGGEWIRNASGRTGLSPHETLREDHEIRLILSEDLGHSRIDATYPYVGR
jgi:site-specific recombinase XerD